MFRMKIKKNGERQKKFQKKKIKQKLKKVNKVSKNEKKSYQTKLK